MEEYENEYERYRFFRTKGKTYAIEGYEKDGFIIDVKEKNGELIQSYKCKSKEGADRILEKIEWVANQTGGNWEVRDIIEEAEELYYK